MQRARTRHALSTLVSLSLMLLLFSFSVAQAQENLPVRPIKAGRPRPIPYQQVVESSHLYNDLLFPALPEAAQAADIEDAGAVQPGPGQGVAQTVDELGAGNTLYGVGSICNDFNQENRWASHAKIPSDIWSDSYAGWGAFAFHDGNFYNADNVTFSLERTVGPGQKSGANQFAAKIASNQPYAAGLGSPLIAVRPGAAVEVSVKYLIFDHDTGGQDFDWASLGLKADAVGANAVYVNGYGRGQWRQLTQRLTAGSSGKIMILLQAQSPAALNSNIYFDDVQVTVNGHYLVDCAY